MLLDTSGVLAAISPLDPQHAGAFSHFHGARRYIIHNYVVAELFPLARKRHVSMFRLLDAISQLLARREVSLFWVTPDIHDRAIDLLRRRADKTYSLCDAVSFVVMREQGVTEALTTDVHFEQEGFVRLLKP
jgi:uncharacterized protein